MAEKADIQVTNSSSAAQNTELAKTEKQQNKNRNSSFKLAVALTSLCVAFGIAFIIYYHLQTENPLDLPVNETSSPTEIVATSSQSQVTNSTVADLPDAGRMSHLLAQFAKANTKNYLFVNLAATNTGNLQGRAKAINLLSVDQEHKTLKILGFNKDLYVTLADYALDLPLNDLAAYQFHEQKLTNISLSDLNLLSDSISRNFYLPLTATFVYNDQLAAEILQSYGQQTPKQIDAYFDRYYAKKLSETWAKSAKTDLANLAALENQMANSQISAFASLLKVLAGTKLPQATTASEASAAESKSTEAKVAVTPNYAEMLDLLWKMQKQNNALGNFGKEQFLALFDLLKQLISAKAQLSALALPLNNYYWVDDYNAYGLRSDFNLQVPALHKFLYQTEMPAFESIPKVKNAPIGYYTAYRMPAALLDNTAAGAYKDWPLLQLLLPSPHEIYPQISPLTLNDENTPDLKHNYLAQKGTLLETLTGQADDIQKIKDKQEALLQVANFALPKQADLDVSTKDKQNENVVTPNDDAEAHSAKLPVADTEAEEPAAEANEQIFTPDPVPVENPVYIP